MLFPNSHGIKAAANPRLITTVSRSETTPSHLSEHRIPVLRNCHDTSRLLSDEQMLDVPLAHLHPHRATRTNLFNNNVP